MPKMGRTSLCNACDKLQNAHTPNLSPWVYAPICVFSLTFKLCETNQYRRSAHNTNTATTMTAFVIRRRPKNCRFRVIHIRYLYLWMTFWTVPSNSPSFLFLPLLYFLLGFLLRYTFTIVYFVLCVRKLKLFFANFVTTDFREIYEMRKFAEKKIKVRTLPWCRLN